MQQSATGLKVFQIYVSEKWKNLFAKTVPRLRQSEIMRGMMILYLTKPEFRTEVDKFVEVTKTI